MSRRVFLTFLASFFLPIGYIQAQEVSQMNAQRKLVSWLLHNTFSDGMPRSYQPPADWRAIPELDAMTVDGVIERVIIANGVSVYDAALRQIVLASLGDKYWSHTDIVTKTLLSGGWKDLANIRACADPFRYQGQSLPREESYFFRLISPDWEQRDPMSGVTHITGFHGPVYDPDRIVWPDWKPITGENAWVGIGALQAAYFKYNGDVEKIKSSDEMRLALSLMPAIEHLMSPIGAVLHAAGGTHDKDPDDISNENNISVYVFLNMLYQITDDKKYLYMSQMIEDYFRTYARDPDTGILWQGGFYKKGTFLPTRIMAVDVQTWAVAVFGPQKLDEWYGKGAALNLWRETRRRAGHLRDGTLYGVGFTEGHDVLSGEWSYGAVAAVLELAIHYQHKDQNIFETLMDDAVSMMEGLESLAVVDGDLKSYLYADRRTYIPFGWYSNPLPSMSSVTWAYFLQTGLHPFRLGGQSDWLALGRFAEAVEKIR